MSGWPHVPCGDEYDRVTLADPGDAITFTVDGCVFLLVRQGPPSDQEVDEACRDCPEDMAPILDDVLMLTIVPLTPEQEQRATRSKEDMQAVLDELHRTCELWCVLTSTGLAFVSRRMPGPVASVQAVKSSEAERILRAQPGARKAAALAISIAMDCWPAWRAKGEEMGITSASDRVAARLTTAALQEAARSGMPVVVPPNLPEA